MNKKPKKRMKIFNWGWYGFENFGDDLLQNTMAEKLLYHPNTELHFAMNTLYEFTDDRISQCGRSYGYLVRNALKYDCLIVGPGGLFPFQNTPKCLLMCLITMWWKLLRKKVMFFGIGVSPRMNRFNAFLWRTMIRHSDLFLTRSNGMIESVGLTETDKVHTMADAAFASNVVGNAEKKRASSKKIGIAVANISNEVIAVYNELLNIWTETVNFFLARGYKVDLIAFTKGADDTLIRDIYNNVSPLYSGGVHTSYYDHVQDAVKAWPEYDQVICMRFHALVLSILAGVPPVPIAYGVKTSRLADKCGLSDYLLSWNPAVSGYFGGLTHVSSKAIVAKSEKAFQDSEIIKNAIERSRKELILSADRAFDELMECCFW